MATATPLPGRGVAAARRPPGRRYGPIGGGGARPAPRAAAGGWGRRRARGAVGPWGGSGGGGGRTGGRRGQPLARPAGVGQALRSEGKKGREGGRRLPQAPARRRPFFALSRSVAEVGKGGGGSEGPTPSGSLPVGGFWGVNLVVWACCPSFVWCGWLWSSSLTLGAGQRGVWPWCGAGRLPRRFPGWMWIWELVQKSRYLPWDSSLGFGLCSDTWNPQTCQFLKSPCTGREGYKQEINNFINRFLCS